MITKIDGFYFLFCQKAVRDQQIQIDQIRIARICRWAILISVVLILSLLVFSFRSGKNLMLIDFDGYNIHHPK